MNSSDKNTHSKPVGSNQVGNNLCDGRNLPPHPHRPFDWNRFNVSLPKLSGVQIPTIPIYIAAPELLQGWRKVLKPGGMGGGHFWQVSQPFLNQGEDYVHPIGINTCPNPDFWTRRRLCNGTGFACISNKIGGGGRTPPPTPSASDGPVYNSVPGLGVSMQLSIAGICLVQETREQGKKKAAD